VISGVSSADHKQAGAVTVRGSASMNLGGSWQSRHFQSSFSGVLCIEFLLFGERTKGNETKQTNTRESALWKSSKAVPWWFIVPGLPGL
jgi:hypothetical protein